MTSSPEFSTFPLNQVLQVWDSRMQFLSVRASGTMYNDKLDHPFRAESDRENRAQSCFRAWQTDRLHGLGFYSVTATSGGCAKKPVISR